MTDAMQKVHNKYGDFALEVFRLTKVLEKGVLLSP